MFKKGLVLVSLVALFFTLPVWANGPDTVGGWIGPTNCSGDTGHIAISDLHTQGQHSLNFVIHYVDNWFDTTREDSLGHAYFSKYFDLELPDSMAIDIWYDTIVNKPPPEFNPPFTKLRLTYQDTVWEAFAAVGADTAWCTLFLDSSDYSMGTIISPDTIENHPPPGHIDTIKFKIVWYTPHAPRAHDIDSTASVLIDNIRFYYADQETLVDGMGDEQGIEEIVSPEFFSLKVYPNPFRNQTHIIYQTGSPSALLISIYDICGRRLFSSRKSSFFWNGRDQKGEKVLSGVYFIKVKKEKKSLINKLIRL